MSSVTEKPSFKESRLLAHIGNTPLLKLERVGNKHPHVEMYAKAEWYNPGGSVKDRAALNIILEGERSGKLTRDKILIDATSGNTGIAYAMIGAVLGYRVHLAVPENASVERKRILSAYGADISYTGPLEGTDGAQRYVQAKVEQNPDLYFHADQYNNPANWHAHYTTTAVEIFEQTRGRVTHFISGLGTTGTFVGTARGLKERNPAITCIAVQPDMPLHGLEGLKHLASARVPGIYDSTLADEHIMVSTEDAYAMMRRLARDEGLLAGASSAAAMVAVLKVAETVREGVIVTVFADSGERYLHNPLWEQ